MAVYLYRLFLQPGYLQGAGVTRQSKKRIVAAGAVAAEAKTVFADEGCHVRLVEQACCRSQNTEAEMPVTPISARFTNTICNCSCWICGNQRFHCGMNMQAVKARLVD